MKNLLITLGLLSGVVFASNPGDAEDRRRGQIAHCKEIGNLFGQMAIARDKGITAQQILSTSKGDMVMPAIELIYGKVTVAPQMAAWYGYGYCMAIAGQGEKV